MPCALACLRTTKASSGRPAACIIGGGDRVGAQGESTHRVECPVRRQLPQQDSDQRRRLVVQGGPAQVHVVVGLAPRGQRDPAVNHGQPADQLGQPGLLTGIGDGGRGALRSGVGHPVSLMTQPDRADSAPSRARLTQ